MDRDSDLLVSLEKAIFGAVAQMPYRRPWVAAERREIIDLAKQCLGVREECIPELKAACVGETAAGRLTVQKLGGVSWPGCQVAAHLYCPDGAARRPGPLVILCCGHGQGGKQAPGYQSMAWQLAQRGAAVLVPDNIGQGERTAMGHRDVIAPFQYGLSLQGLIVMETMGWLRWAAADGRFDKARLAAIGNSGGGVLTLFLGAFCRDELAALSSSGYPSSFEFIARKEKDHCHCNILPGIVGSLEMWQLYGCFAPKPLFICQGRGDHLFPEDLFESTARKVAHAYHSSQAGEAFRAEVFPGEHPWDDERRAAIADFIAGELALEQPAGSEDLCAACGNCYESWPADALSTDEVARRLVKAPPTSGDQPEQLFQVYCPELAGKPDWSLGRVTHHQLVAQWLAFLAPARRRAVC